MIVTWLSGNHPVVAHGHQVIVRWSPHGLRVIATWLLSYRLAHIIVKSNGQTNHFGGGYTQQEKMC